MSIEDCKPSINQHSGKEEDNDSDTSFEKKLELMKAELEELENDFSAKTLDNLTKYSFDGPKVSRTNEKGGRTSDALDDNHDLDNKRSKTPQRNKKEDMVFIPFDALSDTGSSRSEGTVLFGKEYLNNSQHTVVSKFNSSRFSKDHYQKLDPDGECITRKSEINKEDSFILEKDTLDLIKPEEIRRISMGTKLDHNIFFDEEETKLDKDGIDEEWQKFLSEAKDSPHEGEEFDFNKFKLKRDEKARFEYYRSLVTKDIMLITEKKKD